MHSKLKTSERKVKGGIVCSIKLTAWASPQWWYPRKLEKSICIDFMKAYEATILNNYLVLYIEHLLEWAAGKEAL